MPHSLWMPMYWADYFSDTLEFSTFQHGCYLLLIGAYWCRCGPLPNDPAELARICRTSCDKLARYGKPVLARFSCKDGLLYHERIEKELLRSSDRQAAAVANGRAGGLAKSKLPHSTPTKVIEIDSFLVGRGKEEGQGMSPENRLSKFHNWLAPLLGKDGWKIINEAMNPKSEYHTVAVETCRLTAKQNGKGWPHQWPA